MAGRPTRRPQVVVVGMAVAVCLLASSCLVNGGWTASSQPEMDRGRLFSRGLSCPTRNFCLDLESGGYSDHDTGIQRWDGTSWSFEQGWDDTLSLRDAQCSSPTACWIWLRDKDRDFFRAVGTDGRNQPWPIGFVYYETGFLEQPAMSCSPTGCVFLGEGTTTWDGSQYHVQIAVGPTPALKTLSCVSPTECVGTGFLSGSPGSVHSYGWNGTSWNDQSVIFPPQGTTFEPVDLSCTDPGGCLAVGEDVVIATGQRFPAAAHWNGSFWSMTDLPVSGLGRLTSVSCANGIECLAVGSLDVGPDATTAVVLGWTGDTWFVAPRPPGSEFVSYTQVSCPVQRGWCMAVGADGPPDDLHRDQTAVFTWP